MGMALPEEMIAVIREGQTRPRPLIQPDDGRTWVVRFQECLKSIPIEDRTDYRYRNGGAYLLQLALPFSAGDNWTYFVSLHISALGPYVMHAVYRESVTDAQWAGACHLTRNGYTEDHARFLAQLRSCYEKLGLVEPDEQVRALPVPGVKMAGLRGELNVFQCLFRP